MTGPRDAFPAPPDGADHTGAMTEATGSLTPDDPDAEFMPAETREMTDPDAARDLTAAAHRRREARRGEGSDEPGSLIGSEDATAPNDRDGGYGSASGLAADDPAYREEVRLARDERATAEPRGEASLGGDARHDAEDERF